MSTQESRLGAACLLWAAHWPTGLGTGFHELVVHYLIEIQQSFRTSPTQLPVTDFVAWEVFQTPKGLGHMP